jgi:hypothetical protein
VFRFLNRQLARLPGNEFGQRYSIGATMTLRNSDGDVYLFRRRLIQTPLFAVYLHDILDGDEERSPHSHPFAFASLVLRGGYVETVFHPTYFDWPEGTVKGAQGILGLPNVIERKRGKMHTFPRGNGQLHRIVAVEPRTRTLVFAGRRKDSWGFWNAELGEIQNWREYLAERGRQPTGLPIAHNRETNP